MFASEGNLSLNSFQVLETGFQLAGGLLFSYGTPYEVCKPCEEASTTISEPDLQTTGKKALQEWELVRHWKLGPSLTLLEIGQIYTILSSVSGSVLYLQNKDNGDKNMNFKSL